MLLLTEVEKANSREFMETIHNSKPQPPHTKLYPIFVP